MFLFSKKIIFIFFILLFIFNCKRNKQEISEILDYKEFINLAAKESCTKVRKCFGYIYRTFPENILKKSTIEECEAHVLLNVDKKLESHTSNIKLLARSCYIHILNSNCKDLPLVVITDPSCMLLKTEIEKVNGKKLVN
jgi:hypothetical protein